MFSLSRLKSRKCVHGPVQFATIATPIGDVLIASCPLGLHAVGQSDEITDDNFNPDDRVTVQLKTLQDPKELYFPTNVCIAWLQAYFKNPHQVTAIPRPQPCMLVSLHGTFRHRVRTTLAERVGPGATVSYSELARMVGNPKAARAVGSTMRTNPYQIVVPCHRVIKSNGNIGAYSQGCRNKVKQWLLQFEKELR